MDYKTYECRDELKPFVKCYWTLDAPANKIPEKQRIVPDGCMEMIFHCGDLYKQYFDDGGSIIQPKCFVFGQITRVLEIEATGITGIFSVRFLPHGFIPFATMPLARMENTAVPLEALFYEEGIKLQNNILNATTVEEKIRIVEEFLIHRLTDPKQIDKVTKDSVDIMLKLNGQLTVDELTGNLSINRRKLERRFSSIIGLSPKQLSKMIRMQATLKMLANKEVTSLTALAYEGDFYDQAHFIKDFKEFTGICPKKFYANNLRMSALFIDAD